MWRHTYRKYLLLGAIAAGCAACHFKPPPAPISKDNAPAGVAGQAFTSAPNNTLSLVTEPGPGAAPVLSRIKVAQKSVELVIYELEDPAVTAALEQAASRGVAVRVLINGGFYSKAEHRYNKPAYASLAAHHVPVRWTPPYFALTHQKTLVVDGDDALIMTFNLVSKYYPTGRDFGVDDRDPADVQAITRVFDADWRKVSIAPPHATDLLWSPGSETETVSLISKATKSLEIYNEEMKDPVIVRALAAAARRGVHVSIVMTQEAAWWNHWQTLVNAGAHVRVFAKDAKLYIHAKAIVADRKLVFVGSENFSWTSLGKNRELGIVTANTDIITGVEHAFARDWKNAKPWRG